MKLPSIKTQLIIFLALFALYLAIIDKDPLFLLMASVAVIFSIATDSLCVYLKEKKFLLTESSVIAGLIVGYVLASDQKWWLIALAAFFTILSKHTIQIRKKHIFNPAGFGIFLVILLFGATTQWKGTFAWYIVVPLGFYFAHKVNKLEVLLSYAVVALGLFGVQALIQKVALFHIFGYLSYFYIFVMLIEPKTTPIKPLGKIIFGAGVAALIFILTESGVQFDVELLSLLGFNISVPLLNKLPQRRSI